MSRKRLCTCQICGAIPADLWEISAAVSSQDPRSQSVISLGVYRRLFIETVTRSRGHLSQLHSCCTRVSQSCAAFPPAYFSDLEHHVPHRKNKPMCLRDCALAKGTAYQHEGRPIVAHYEKLWIVNAVLPRTDTLR